MAALIVCSGSCWRSTGGSFVGCLLLVLDSQPSKNSNAAFILI
jgi:hypothetical protein